MSEPAVNGYPCPSCGNPYSIVDPKEWHVNPTSCKACRSCPDCKTLFSDVTVPTHCATCRRNWCMEHSRDRRSASHIIIFGHCRPGEF